MNKGPTIAELLAWNQWDQLIRRLEDWAQALTSYADDPAYKLVEHQLRQVVAEIREVMSRAFAQRESYPPPTQRKRGSI